MKFWIVSPKKLYGGLGFNLVTPNCAVALNCGGYDCDSHGAGCELFICDEGKFSVSCRFERNCDAEHCGYEFYNGCTYPLVCSNGGYSCDGDDPYFTCRIHFSCEYPYFTCPDNFSCAEGQRFCQAPMGPP